MTSYTHVTGPSIVPLEELVRDARSGFASGDRDANGVVQVRMNNVTTDAHWDWSNILRVPASRRQIEQYSLRQGDVLFNHTNSPELVGKNALFDGQVTPAVFSNHFIRLRSDPARLDPRYLSLWLVDQWKHKVFERLCTRWVNQATVRKEDLLALAIPLRSLPEQKRIAAILERADRLRRLRRYAVQLSDTYLQAVFLEMFGDPVRNPKGWDFDSFDRAITTTRNGTGKRQPVDDMGTIVLRIRDVGAGSIDYSQPRRIRLSRSELAKYSLQEGNLLLVRVNGNRDLVGRAALFMLLDEPVAFSDHVIRVTLDRQEMHPVFALYLLNSPYGRTQVLESVTTTAGQFTINRSGLSRISAPYPPLPRQEQFSRVVARHERLLAQQREAARQAEHLFQTLLQRTFRGEL